MGARQQFIVLMAQPILATVVRMAAMTTLMSIARITWFRSRALRTQDHLRCRLSFLAGSQVRNLGHRRSFLASSQVHLLSQLLLHQAHHLLSQLLLPPHPLNMRWASFAELQRVCWPWHYDR